MSYFIKKSNRQNGVYLQIYESFYDSAKKCSRHKAIKTLGYVSKLKEQGIDDPISYYQSEVDKMNKKHNDELAEAKTKMISDSPVKNLGYFLAKGVLNKLKIKDELRPFKLIYDTDYDLFELLEALIYSRIINPVSKLKTWQEVIPQLYEDHSFSLNQIYSGCELLGNEYERIIEIFNHQIKKIYGRQTGKIYFDCTNYYFEIDTPREDLQKGPSKENRKEPIIGMALMLDENQIPIGMQMYPGNESEKPYLRKMVKDMKERNCITGKTIQVADKGLNCGQNIYEALLNKDGYIFSKSVKMLPEIEKTWVLLDNDQWVNVNDENGVLLYKYKECIDKYPYKFKDSDGIERKFNFKEKRIVTYNPKLAKKATLEIDKLAEKALALSNSMAKKSEYGEAGKYVTFSSINKETGELSNGEDVKAVVNLDKINEDKKLAGYNLLVTSELKMPAQKIYETYHNLWKIEESFRILKSQFATRPVYLQKRESIYGHFLICYLAVTILRILQYVEFDNRFCCNSIVDFMRSFQCVKDKKTVINISPSSKVTPFDNSLNLNLRHFYLTGEHIKKLLGFEWR